MNSNRSYSLETQNSSKKWEFLPQVNLTFDGWPWKSIGHHCYTTSSFEYNFRAIVEFKLEWLSGKSDWGQNWQFLLPCDLKIWQMTLKNNRVPSLWHFKLCASFCSIDEFKLELQTGNAQFESKWYFFYLMWPWNLMDHRKTIGHHF